MAAWCYARMELIAGHYMSNSKSVWLIVGLIINVASAGGLWPMPMAPVYATAKAGVVQFTRSVAPTLIKQGIRCCALCPQQVDTPLVCLPVANVLV